MARRTLLRSSLASTSAWIAFSLVACSSPPTLQGQGGRCLQVSDCKLGFVCIPAPGRTDGVCSSDTSSLVSTEDAATDAGAAPQTDGAGAVQD